MHFAIFFLAATLAACDGPTTPDEVEACMQLSESNCLESTTCTLFQVAPLGEYSCRAAVDSCEEGFRQTIDTREDCEAQTGCVFAPGNCYCPPGLVCVCGGGPPPQCRAAS